MLLCIIHGLTNKFGFCWASNRYLSEQTNLSVRMIQYNIAKLKKEKYIIVEIQNGRERKIWTAATWAYRDKYIEVDGPEIINCKSSKELDQLVPMDGTRCMDGTHAIAPYIIDINNTQRHKEEAPRGDFPSKPINKSGCQKCTWHNPPESQHQKQVYAKKEPPKPKKPEISPKPKEKKQQQVRILLPDGTIQLEKLPDNGFIPTPGSDKMVKELQEEVLCDAFQCGTSKFRIHRGDWYRFYGFSPATIRQAAYNICKRSRNGEKISNYTACLLAECARIRKANRG
jgi:hypothetical protein